MKSHISSMFYDSLCIYHPVKLSNNSPITIEMVLYERLQMLYEPKIRVTGSFRKLLHILYERTYRFFMRQMQFRPDIQP